MIDIEEFSKKLFDSYYFKDLFREQVSYCIKDLTQEEEKDITLEALTKEIGTHLASITEFAIEEDNCDRYLSSLRKNEELYS